MLISVCSDLTICQDSFSGFCILSVYFGVYCLTLVCLGSIESETWSVHLPDHLIPADEIRTRWNDLSKQAIMVPWVMVTWEMREWWHDWWKLSWDTHRDLAKYTLLVLAHSKRVKDLSRTPSSWLQYQTHLSSRVAKCKCLYCACKCIKTYEIGIYIWYGEISQAHCLNIHTQSYWCCIFCVLSDD